MGTEIRIVTAADRATAEEIVAAALAGLVGWVPQTVLAELAEHMVEELLWTRRGRLQLAECAADTVRLGS